MRSVTHVIAGEIANSVKGEDWTKHFFNQVVHRPDDIVEILAYYQTQYGKPFPNSLKKGLAKAFEKFDKYQLSKYRASDKGMKLIDAVNIVHPKPVGDNAEALKLLVANQLANEDTWETLLTQAGQNAKSIEEKAALKTSAWTKLISERKLGYFALLRNLRNIINQAPAILNDALTMLTDESLIHKSLVLPFRYTTALQTLENEGETPRNVIVALNKAVDISLSNVPKLDGKTLIALDCSGSMQGQPLEIGALFASVLYKSNDADLLLFSNDANYLHLNPTDSTLSLANQIKQRAQIGGTNFHAIFQRATKTYNRIIILSDMQGWIGYDAPTASFNEYKQRTQSDPFIYSFDLQGYSTLQFPERKVFALTGFSEKIFDIMATLETDKNALINKIKNVEL
jgi:hypothetical protein